MDLSGSWRRKLKGFICAVKRPSEGNQSNEQNETVDGFDGWKWPCSSNKTKGSRQTVFNSLQAHWHK